MLKTTHLIIIALTSLFATICLAAPTFALDGITIQISPTSHKIALEPGNTYTDSVSIQNLSDQDFNYTMSLRPYQAQDIFYKPDFSTENSYTQIIKWITFAEPTGTLAAHSSKDIKYEIKVPADVPDGGQYAALIAETPAQANPGSIELVSSVGSLLYAHVGGNTRESGDLVSNHIWPFQISSPVTAESTVKNTGNVDFDVTTTLKIANFFGGNVVYDNSDEPLVQTVLPDSTRLNLVTWYGTPKLGIFTVTETTSFLDQTSSITNLVLVCPLWLVLIFVIIIILIIILVGSHLVKRAKTRRQRQAV